jgi:hypothetical protein
MLDVEFRFTPIAEPGDWPAPGTSTEIVEYPPFRVGERGFSNVEKARDELLCISEIGRMGCPKKRIR